jgi:hypothetical protein
MNEDENLQKKNVMRKYFLKQLSCSAYENI